jgi:transposase, IS5 family
MTKQSGLFDLPNRLEKISQVKDFLDKINLHVDWEVFRPLLNEAAGRSSPSENGGRPAYDVVLMFKILVLQALYNLSDEQTEYQILDRLSFMRFLGLELHNDVPDAKTIWLFREKLRTAGVVEKLFDQFDAFLNEAGFAATGGQMIDASFVEVPVQHNSKSENDEIKQGKTPEGWSSKKRAHKDTDARWTKKNKKSYFGYKNHINADRKYKIIRRYKVTPASVHDSQEMDAILDPSATDKDVWADSAYRSEEQEQSLKDAGLTSQIHERAYRNKPLTEDQKAANTEKSRVRVRVEHIFGHIENSMHGCFVRTIGIARASVKIGLENLAYNISRFSFLASSRAKNAAA